MKQLKNNYEALLIISMILILCACSSEKTDKDSKKHIPGIMPGDIYLNFENRGFKKDRQISEDGSVFWLLDKEDVGIQYNVRVYSENGVNDVDHVRLNAIRIMPQNNAEEDMKPFLKYGCSIQFTGYDINTINNFIDTAYYKDKSSIIISGVKFSIYCPTEFTRMIDIERSKTDK